MQDAVIEPTRRWVLDVDYGIVDNELSWITTPPNLVVWAPQVWRVNTRAVEILAAPLPVDLDLDNWPLAKTPAAVGALRVLWYAFLHGPTLANTAAAVNAAMGLDYARHAGLVTNVSPGSVTVRYGATAYGIGDAEGKVLCGSSLRSQVPATILTDRTVVQIDDVSGLDPGDWLIPSLADGQAARQIRRVHEVSPIEVLAVQIGGTVNDTGHVFSGGIGWGDVEQGDILRITFPERLAGTFPIDQPLADGAFFQKPLLGDGENILFAIDRDSWVEVWPPFEAEGAVALAVVRPSFDWPDDMWIGSEAEDHLGNRHHIKSSGKSTLEVGHEVPRGPLTLRPLFLGDEEDTDVFMVPDQASPLVREGDYFRRFSPVIDGVQLIEWRGDDRWKPQDAPVLPLAAAPRGTTLTIGSTDGLVEGSRWLLVAKGQANISLSVDSIDSATEITASVDVPVGYSLDNMARLVPLGLPVEGLDGHFVVDEGGRADTSADGLVLTDSAKTFPDSPIRVGDEVRVVADGDESFAIIDTIQSDATLSMLTLLPANLSDVFYQVVRRYNRANVHTLAALVVPYRLGLYHRNAVEAIIRAISPSHLRINYSDVALSSLQYEDAGYGVGQIISDSPELEILSVIEPPAVPVAGPGSDYVAGVSDEDELLIAGPIRYNWLVSEFYRASFGKRAGTTNPVSYDRDTSGTPADGHGRVWDLQGGETNLQIAELQVAADLSTLEVVRDSTVSSPLSMEAWSQADGRSLSFYFFYDGQAWEAAVGEGLASVDKVVFSAPPDAISSAAIITIAIASPSGVRGRPF